MRRSPGLPHIPKDATPYTTPGAEYNSGTPVCWSLAAKLNRGWRGWREAGMSEQNISGREDLERRNHELSVLNEIARQLNRSVELGEALGFTLSQVAELLGLRTA